MQLIKVKDGLIELDNFLLASPIEDFLGNGTFTRDNKTFTLKDGSVERKLSQDEFLIVVEKEDTSLTPDDEYEFYLSDGKKKAGIKEVFNDNYAKYWKLIYYDDYIQGYCSDNGFNWQNVGGKRLEGVKHQGFSTKGTELALNDYRLYRNPYITIQNFYPGTKVKLLDREGNLVKERLFEDNYECKIFLDYPIIGSLQFYNNDELIYETNLIPFKYGDIFMFTKYHLELFYKERLLNYRTTTLESLSEVLVLKNASEDDYYDLTIKLNNPNTDDIMISLDNENFYQDNLVIESIESMEEINIYVRIIKDKSEYFKMNDFTLDIY